MGPDISAARFFTSVPERSESFDDMVEGATCLHVLGISAVNLLSSHKATLRGLIQSGCAMKFALLDPHGAAAKELTRGNPVHATMVQLSCAALNELKSISGALLHVRAISRLPSVSMIFVSKNLGGREQTFVQVQLYLLNWTTIGSDRPLFRIDATDMWFSVFRAEFDYIWHTLGRDWTFEAVMSEEL
jgi:hypothetical protein